MNPEKKITEEREACIEVKQIDTGQYNALPRAAAFILAIKLNRKALLSVYQTNEVSHTKANAATWILRIFHGVKQYHGRAEFFALPPPITNHFSLPPVLSPNSITQRKP
jgi:hypothetical protein